jgi:hypothetical protein
MKMSAPSNSSADALSKRNYIGIEGLLSRLEKVRKIGQNRWVACCPAHNDRTPSLQISETQEGIILIKDFGQDCNIGQIASAIDVNVSDLFPENTKSKYHAPIKRARFDAAHILQCLAQDTRFVFMCAKHIATGEPLLNSDQKELLAAYARIERALAAGGFGQ